MRSFGSTSFSAVGFEQFDDPGHGSVVDATVADVEGHDVWVEL